MIDAIFGFILYFIYIFGLGIGIFLIINMICPKNDY